MTANDSLWVRTVSAEDHKEPIFRYYGFNPSTTVLPEGHRRFPNKRAFPCDIIYERDTAVQMRDGIKIYTDIFRLPQKERVPAVICWSPYGKVGTPSGKLSPH